MGAAVSRSWRIRRADRARGPACSRKLKRVCDRFLNEHWSLRGSVPFDRLPQAFQVQRRRVVDAIRRSISSIDLKNSGLDGQLRVCAEGAEVHLEFFSKRMVGTGSVLDGIDNESKHTVLEYTEARLRSDDGKITSRRFFILGAAARIGPETCDLVKRIAYT